LKAGHGILKVAKMTGLGTGTVHALKREMAATADATEVVEIYRDAGISGAKGRGGRPGRDRPISADILRQLRRDYGK
jgi:hypothetical protein